MKIKRISEITAVLLFIGFLLLLIFSHRQDLFTDTTINAYNTGWTYSYDAQEGDTVLPVNLMSRKIQKSCLPIRFRMKFRMIVQLPSGQGCRVSKSMWETD